jgi:hypothetical protein
VVAHQGHVHHAVNRLENLDRVGAVTDDIAEADDPVRLQVGEVGQHGLPRGQVGVQV